MVDKRILILGILVGTAVLISLLFVLLDLVHPPRAIRDIGKYYVENTIADTSSPEAVAAVVWDYRGLDTIYETVVLYLALIGGLSVFRSIKVQPLEKTIGLTMIARTSGKLIALMIASISACIALHGHLTPGGGFQGGSTAAVIAMLVIPVFTVNALVSRGITPARLMAIRGLSLTFIGFIALLPVIRGFELVTNQRFYPASLFGMTISGSISMYNLFEYFAVASGFAALALYLSVPEERGGSV